MALTSEQPQPTQAELKAAQKGKTNTSQSTRCCGKKWYAINICGCQCLNLLVFCAMILVPPAAVFNEKYVASGDGKSGDKSGNNQTSLVEVGGIDRIGQIEMEIGGLGQHGGASSLLEKMGRTRSAENGSGLQSQKEHHYLHAPVEISPMVSSNSPNSPLLSETVDEKKSWISSFSEKSVSVRNKIQDTFSFLSTGDGSSKDNLSGDSRFSFLETDTNSKDDKPTYQADIIFLDISNAAISGGKSALLFLVAIWFVWVIFALLLVWFFKNRLSDDAEDVGGMFWEVFCSNIIAGGTSKQIFLYHADALQNKYHINESAASSFYSALNCCAGSCYTLLHWLLIVGIVISGLFLSFGVYAGAGKDATNQKGKLYFSLGGHATCFMITSFTRWCHTQWREICWEESANWAYSKLDAAQDVIGEKYEAMAQGINDYVASGRENLQDSYAYIMSALYGESEGAAGGKGGGAKEDDGVSLCEKEERDGVDIAEEHCVGVTEDGYLAALYALWEKDPEAAKEEADVLGQEETVHGKSITDWIASWQQDPKAAKKERMRVRNERREARRHREIYSMGLEDHDAGKLYGRSVKGRHQPKTELIYPPKEEEGWFAWMAAAWVAEQKDGEVLAGEEHHTKMVKTHSIMHGATAEDLSEMALAEREQKLRKRKKTKLGKRLQSITEMKLDECSKMNGMLVDLTSARTMSIARGTSPGSGRLGSTNSIAGGRSGRLGSTNSIAGGRGSMEPRSSGFMVGAGIAASESRAKNDFEESRAPLLPPMPLLPPIQEAPSTYQSSGSGPRSGTIGINSSLRNVQHQPTSQQGAPIPSGPSSGPPSWKGPAPPESSKIKSGFVEAPPTEASKMKMDESEAPFSPSQGGIGAKMKIFEPKQRNEEGQAVMSLKDLKKFAKSSKKQEQLLAGSGGNAGGSTVINTTGPPVPDLDLNEPRTPTTPSTTTGAGGAALPGGSFAESSATASTTGEKKKKKSAAALKREEKQKMEQERLARMGLIGGPGPSGGSGGPGSKTGGSSSRAAAMPEDSPSETSTARGNRLLPPGSEGFGSPSRRQGGYVGGQQADRVHGLKAMQRALSSAQEDLDQAQALENERKRRESDERSAMRNSRGSRGSGDGKGFGDMRKGSKKTK